MSALEKIKAGLYRNTLGAELHVLWPVIAVREFKVLGPGIWEAEARDDLFGRTPYLVTLAGLNDCGYALIEAEVPADDQ